MSEQLKQAEANLAGKIDELGATIQTTLAKAITGLGQPDPDVEQVTSDLNALSSRVGTFIDQVKSIIPDAPAAPAEPTPAESAPAPEPAA